MTYIKWKREKPFVYRSERSKTFVVVDFETIEKQRVKSVYLGTYQKYREKKPNGTFESLVKPETRLKWMAEKPDRLKSLHLIDERVYREFERTRS